MIQDFSLDPQLVKDTTPLGDLALSRVLVMNNAMFPWLILVPRRAGLVELIDLDDAERGQLMTDISHVSTALKEVTRCVKLNVAALGNMVPQLHVHVIARFREDAAWPRPVWGHGPARPYTPDALARLTDALRQRLWP